MAYFLSQEQFFYVWDKQIYHNILFQSIDNLGKGWGDWFDYIKQSFHGEYNALFTVPLLPFILLFGESRLVMMLAIYVVYLIPCSLLLSAIFNQMVGKQKGVYALILPIATLLTTTTWAALLHGMPDIGGAMCLMAAFLLYVRQRSESNLKSYFLIGVLLALTFLFRRHFGYGIISVCLVIGLDQLFIGIKSELQTTLKNWLQSAVRLSLMVIATIGMLWLVSPDFLTRLEERLLKTMLVLTN